MIEGLYAVTPEEPDTEVLTRKVRAALAGGARVLQYRNKTLDARGRREQAAALHALCLVTGIPLIVNDDVDLALAIRAGGVHLGREDADLAGARDRLPQGAIIGASCYASLDRASAARRAGADYVAFGSAFPSSTKPRASRVPISLYREARRTLDCPIVAIGGITPENSGILIEAGVHAVAVISSLFDAPDIECRAREFSSLFHVLLAKGKTVPARPAGR